MKLKDLKSVLSSPRGRLQLAILYDGNSGEDIADGPVDHIVHYYGEMEVVRIEAFKNELVITVEP